MQNPWLFLPEAGPFVLPDDRETIQNFNNRLQTKQEHKIHLEFLPEPYLGNPQAKVVLLNGNPGFDKGDYTYHKNVDFVKTSRANLYHENVEYPFYLLNPQNEKSPGLRWWRRKLRQHLDRYGTRFLFCRSATCRQRA